MRVVIIAGIALCMSCSDSTTTTNDATALYDARVAADAAKGTDAALANECTRQILETAASNARDLGGWPTADGRIACRQIFRGPALSYIDDTGCSDFAELGIKTVIDLRDEPMQEYLPPPECVTEIATHVPAPLPKLLPASAENYLALMDETDAIVTVFSTLAAAETYPVYIHCEIGRDRASFISALVLRAVGATRDTVIEDYLLSNDMGVAVDEAWLAAVLDEIEVRGGIEDYLQSVGVESATIDELRLHITNPETT